MWERIFSVDRCHLSATERNCELGYTWFDAAYFGSAVNTDSKLLMLTFAFETLEILRVQLTVDARNERSQASIKASPPYTPNPASSRRKANRIWQRATGALRWTRSDGRRGRVGGDP